MYSTYPPLISIFVIRYKTLITVCEKGCLIRLPTQFIEIYDIMVSESVVWFVLVAAIWGFTTPLLRHGSVGIDKVRGKTFIHRWLNELHFLATNWKYVLVFLINQSGSLIYALALGPADLSFAVPVTNALTFIFTTIAGRLVGETEKNFKSTLGVGLVAGGIVLCILDKAWS